MRWLLDSTVLIDYLRGRPAVQRVRALHEAGETVVTSAINAEEIVRGLREPEQEAARALFAGLAVLPVTERDAWRAGTWRREHAARGRALWPADCLIAAAALHAGARLATGNPKDFPMLPGQVEHWPVGT